MQYSIFHMEKIKDSAEKNYFTNFMEEMKVTKGKIEQKLRYLFQLSSLKVEVEKESSSLAIHSVFLLWKWN